MEQDIKNGVDTAYLIERSGARGDRHLHIRTSEQPAWTIKAGIGRDGKGANRLDALNIYANGKILRPTPRFMARLMGLPDFYELPESMAIAVTLLGNGVACGVATALLTSLLPYMQRRRNQL
ncbi:DNA cytosine methyltransferase [Gloeothece citriformis]|uniref:DNA cytosine methyltransferase n=1 Tax=Gloeothece citriformis TaxID=2546356 RepID=UPI00059E9840|nr:DNA cytosine methyltransferase [Gloeothece citriformis]